MKKFSDLIGKYFYCIKSDANLKLMTSLSQNIYDNIVIIVATILPKDLNLYYFTRHIVRNSWITGSIEGLIPLHI